MKASRMVCRRSTWRSRKAYVLSNGLLRVTALCGGGHIAEIRFEESTGHTTVNPLWVPQWRTMDPQSYRADKHSKEFGSVTEGKLLSGIAGHNICLDYFGSPSPEEARVGFSQHGEAPNSAWTVESHPPGPDSLGIDLAVTLPSSGLKLKRTLSLHEGESMVYFRETVINTRRMDHIFHWTQHVTLGSPFLDRKSTTVAISGSRGLTSPHGYDEGKALLASGEKFRWPSAPGVRNVNVDLTRPFSRQGTGYVVAVLVERAREIGFVAALNTKERLLFGYCFPRAVFPWITLWEENLAIEALPWRGKARALGLEFGTTPIPSGRRENLVSEGPLLGTPTATFVPALGRRSVNYFAFLTSVPRGFLHLEDIRLEHDAILLFGRGLKRPVRLSSANCGNYFKGFEGCVPNDR